MNNIFCIEVDFELSLRENYGGEELVLKETLAMAAG